MNQEAAVILLEDLRHLPATRLLVDHQSDPNPGVHYSLKRAFGSSYKTHLVRSSLQIEAVSNVPGRVSVILRHIKNNFGPLLPDIYFDIQFEDDCTRLELATEADIGFRKILTLPAAQRVERFLVENGPLTADKIAKGTAFKKKTVQNAVSKLRKGGKIPHDVPRNSANEPVYELLPG